MAGRYQQTSISTKCLLSKISANSTFKCFHSVATLEHRVTNDISFFVGIDVVDIAVPEVVPLRAYSIPKSHTLRIKYDFTRMKWDQNENILSVNFSTEKFDQFPESREGYETVGSEPGSPSDEIERPPLRYIDKYMKPQFFGLSARYTVAIMAMIGFIISFGMKNNVSTAKIAKKSLTGVS